jgi:Insect cuticle protein
MTDELIVKKFSVWSPPFWPWPLPPPAARRTRRTRATSRSKLSVKPTPVAVTDPATGGTDTPSDSFIKPLTHSLGPSSYAGSDYTSRSEASAQKGSGYESGNTNEGTAYWVSPEGQKITISWVADEGGFRPVGDHLPTPPPIPKEIAEMLATLPKEPAYPAYPWTHLMNNLMNNFIYFIYAIHAHFSTKRSCPCS